MTYYINWLKEEYLNGNIDLLTYVEKVDHVVELEGISVFDHEKSAFSTDGNLVVAQIEQKSVQRGYVIVAVTLICFGLIAILFSVVPQVLGILIGIIGRVFVKSGRK